MPTPPIQPTPAWFDTLREVVFARCRRWLNPKVRQVYRFLKHTRLLTKLLGCLHNNRCFAKPRRVIVAFGKWMAIEYGESCAHEITMLSPIPIYELFRLLESGIRRLF